MEVDISSISTAKALFAECYDNHFIRKGHIAKGENLKLYFGVFDPDDVEMLQDLILTCVNEALKKVDSAQEAQLGKYNIPGIL